VSPTAKNGWPTTVVSVSPDGSHVASRSFGEFAGSDQLGVESAYETVRTPTGWNTSPLDEPAGLINTEFENPPAESSDSSKGLFVYRSSSTQTHDERDLYIHALPSGGPVEVGPIYSEAALALASEPVNTPPSVSIPSASSDLARVLFTIRGPGASSPSNYLWTGDTTALNTGPLWGSLGFASLYEYAGTGGSEPELVGVKNKRSLAEEAKLKNMKHINETAELISECGIAQGFPIEGIFSKLTTGESYNAISADGSRVFFTAAAATEGQSGDSCTASGEGHGPPVNEIYAREELPSEELVTSEGRTRRTVAISEPSQADCSTCDTSSPQPAVFQGASEDGSKVFFLSEQHLLPGSEGEDLYEYDFNAEVGDRVVLVASNMQEFAPGTGAPQGVARVSEDGSHVYFVATSVLTTEPDLSLRTGHQSAVQGEDNLYVYDTVTKETAFIGSLEDPADESDWQEEDNGRPVDANSCLPGECESGRFLVFTSSADLTPGDTSEAAQVFEYDAKDKSLVRVSIGQGGFNNNGNTDEFAAGIFKPRYSGSSQDPAPQLSSVSADGSYVAFQSSDALTPAAAAGSPNVYEFHDGQVSLISDGQRDPNTSLLGLDSSGADIFFETSDPLVPQDGDTQIDVYDARIEGGFPGPSGPPSCEGDGCQGALAPAPPFSAIVSASQPAGEQVTEPVGTSAPKVKPKKTKPKKTKPRKTKPKKARSRKTKGRVRSKRRRTLHGVGRNEVGGQGGRV
jgi:hypothetical protein